MDINVAINDKEIYLPFEMVSITLNLRLYASGTYKKSNKETREKKMSRKKTYFSDVIFSLSQSSLILFVLRWMRLPLPFHGSVYETQWTDGCHRCIASPLWLILNRHCVHNDGFNRHSSNFPLGNSMPIATEERRNGQKKIERKKKYDRMCGRTLDASSFVRNS